MPRRARQTTAVGNADGSILVISADSVYADDHEIFRHPTVKAHPEWFFDVLDDPAILRSAKVEQATAAPGEGRNARKP